MICKATQLFIFSIATSGLGHGQSIIQTLLGGSPNNVAALSATLNNPVGIACDSAGNLYVSVQGLDQVVKIDNSGIVSVYAGTGASGFNGDGGPAASAALNNPAGLALDSGGNLYIADSNNNRIRKVSTNGLITTVAGSAKSGYAGDGGPATNASLNVPSAIAFDQNGSLLIADTGNSVIRIVSGGTISTLAGVGQSAAGGDNGPAKQAGLKQPAGVAVDVSGNVYISDTGNNTIRVISTNGIINAFAGQYVAGNSGDHGYANNATLNHPTGLAFDQAGFLYFVDQNNDRVRRIAPTGIISTYAGSGVQGGAGDEGVATGAGLNVRGIALDIHNNLFIADGGNNRVRKVTAADGIIDTVAGNGLATFTPRALVVSGDILYYCDTTSNRVRILNTLTGETSLLAGNGSASFSGDTGAALTAGLSGPRGLAMDNSGNFYIADTGNHRIRRIDKNGVITTIAGDGTAASTNDGSNGTYASVNFPVDVAADSQGNLYIAESSGQRIRKLAANGTISTVAGTGTDQSGTGLGTNQNLSSPNGVAVEPSGTVLIADTNHNRVLRLFDDGTITLVAGGNGSGFSGDGSPATNAQLRSPLGLSADPAGNIYIADSLNQAIRQIGADGIITTVAGLSSSSSATRTGGYNGDGSPATTYSLNQPSNVAALSNCTAFVSDMVNRRIRKLWLAVDYTINTDPPGLKAIVDGQAVATPFAASWLPGTQHTVITPDSQPGPSGTQYVSSASQTFSVPCGPARASVTVPVLTQYFLTINAGPGGTVAPSQGWQGAGSQLALTASPYPGYVFSQWTGDCTGLGPCQLTMNGPKSVGAVFNVSGTGPKPVISNGGIVTPAAFGGVNGIAPGAWVEIHGANLSPVTTPWSATSFNGNTAPTSLGGVSVTIGGKPAFVSYVSPEQINAQVPDETGAGPTSVIVANGYGTSEAASVTASALLPGIDAPFGNGYVAAFQGPTIVGSPGYSPVRPGDVVTLYGNGFGPVSPSVSAGQIATAMNTLVTSLTVRIGGVDASVSYDGLSVGSVGLYQFNVSVPDVPDGDQTIVIDLGGNGLSRSLLITVKR